MPPGRRSPSSPPPENFLRHLFGFLGVTRFEIVRADGVRLGPQPLESSLAAGLAQVAALEVA